MSENKAYLFLSSLKNQNVVLPDGTTAVFRNGYHTTYDEDHAAYLTTMAKSAAVPHITINPEKVTVDPDELNPIVAAQRNAVKDFMALHSLAMDSEGNVSFSDSDGGAKNVKSGIDSVSPALAESVSKPVEGVAAAKLKSLQPAK